MTSDAGNISKSGESSFTELGKDGTRVAETLVSITSFLGGFEICKCNGGFIDFEGFSAGVKSILTSASLCRLSDIDFTGASWDDVTIKVCLPNGEFAVGKLHYCDLESGLAVVNISNDYDFAAVDLSSKHGEEYGHEAVEAVAFRRCFDSGSLRPTPKVLIPYGGTPWNFENNKAWIGGPLVNVEGDFLGLSAAVVKEIPVYKRMKLLIG